MTNPDKLNSSALPSHDEFYSALKNRNISEEDYAYCQMIWRKEQMSTMRDYLIWYNNKDVGPFLEAIQKQFDFYQTLKVDMFKDGISVPGLTLKYLLNTGEANFTLINQNNADLHDLITHNNVGGPSVIFCGCREAGKTKLCDHHCGEAAKTCQSVVGYDAKALYLWFLMQAMPNGCYVRCRAEEQFKPCQPDVWGKTAAECTEWEASQIGNPIRHKYNSKEKCIGQRQLPIDRWCVQTNTVYQFHGCYWHGHECMQEKGITRNEKNNKTMEQLRADTERNSQYIQQCGYNLKEMSECEWKKMKTENPYCHNF